MKAFFTLLLLSIGLIIKAQTPSFQMTISGQEVTSACVGATITFTNTSAVLPENLKWDFGNGATVLGTSNYPYTYSSAGTFTVKLINTVTNAESAKKTIIINKNPVAKINVSASQSCAGNAIQFSGSVDASSAIKYYYWTFGDGGSITQQSSTTHTFNKSGTYSSFLYVEDVNGCRSQPSTARQIQVTGSSNTSFLANGDKYYSCNNAITFSNTTIETGATSYTWDFGDGTGSSAKDPGIHTYSHAGKYTVVLTANIGGNSGCTPIFSKDIYIGKPAISINMPNTVCSNSWIPTAGDMNPSDFKTTAKDLVWSIDGGGGFNGDTSYLQVGNVSGNYHLTATNRIGCPNPTTKTINVKSGTNFSLSVNPPYGICTSIPAVLTSTINDNSTIVKYYWNFGDGKIDSTSTNVHTHQYMVAGNYNANVSILNREGCTSSSSISIPISANCIDNGLGSVYNNLFSFSSSCQDKYLVTFVNKDTAKIVSGWEIDGIFHAATNDSSRVQLSKGKNDTYDVITDYKDGSKSKATTITVVDEVADFTMQNKDNSKLYCAQNNFLFTVNDSVNINNLTNLQWTITDAKTGETIINSSSLSRSFGYVLPLASTYNVKLDLTDRRTPGCISSVTKTISTQGPVLDISVLSDSTFCNPNATVIFKNKAVAYKGSPITRMDWSYGDGIYNTFTTGNISDSVIHSYHYDKQNNYFAYTVTVSASDTVGCVGAISKWYYIKFYNPQVSFNTADTILCTSRKILIDNTSSVASGVYTWTVGDTTKVYQNRSDLNLNVKVDSFPKYYDVRLHVKDEGGCVKDTLIKNYIKFLKPSASFKLNNPNILNTCPTYTLDLLSESKNIDSLSWSLGDGSETSDINPFYTVLHPGPFSIKLIAIGYDGCTDTISQDYLARGPIAKLSASDSIGCTPFRTDLSIQSNSSIVSYQWNYGDGDTYTTNTAKKVTHSYITEGNYWPSVTVVGDEGCTDNLHLSDSVIVKHLSPTFELVNGGLFCNRDTAFFANTTLLNSFPIRKFIWNWDDSTKNETSIVDSIKHVFSTSKNTYKVSLTALTDFCSATSDSVEVSYHLMPKILNISTDSSYCMNDTLLAKAFITNTETADNTYQWSLGNTKLNVTDSIIKEPIKTLADQLHLKIVTEAGCSVDTSIAILIHALPTIKISSLDSAICIGDSASFSVNGGLIYTWLPLNKLVQKSDTSVYVFPSSDATYFVKGSDINGCIGSDSFRIKVDQKVGLKFQEHYEYCTTDTSGLLINVSAENVVDYKWSSSPLDSLMKDNGSSIKIYPKNTTTYSVEAVSSNVCPNEQGMILVSAYDLPKITFPVSILNKAAGDVFTTNPEITNASPGLKYHWIPETRIDNPFTLNPSIIGDKNITYTLHITSSYGCDAIDSVKINVLCSSSKLLMANAFTPNGDGVNDKFYVTGYGIQSVDHFIIIDRWGKKVFERNSISSNDINQGWDGTINGKTAAPGTYLYVVNLTCTEGEKFTLKGSVVLIR